MSDKKKNKKFKDVCFEKASICLANKAFNIYKGTKVFQCMMEERKESKIKCIRMVYAKILVCTI